MKIVDNEISCLSKSGTKITEIPPQKNKNNDLDFTKSRTKCSTTTFRKSLAIPKDETATVKRSKSIGCSRSSNSIFENESKVNKGFGFFKKIIGMRKSKISSNSEEVCIHNCSLESEATPIKDSTPNASINYSPTSSIITELPCADLTKEINDMVSLGIKISESEKHIKDIIVRYVSEKNFKTDLWNLIRDHNNLLMDSEIEALNINNEAWFQQTENYRYQIKNMQITINSLLRQNRELQAEHDVLMQKPSRTGPCIVFTKKKNIRNRGDTLSSNKVINDLSKSNIDLKNKLENSIGRIEELDDNLKNAVNKNSFINQQLTGSNMQLHKSKITFDRHKAKLELEIFKLNQEMKRSKEIADLLIGDINATGFKFESLTKNINLDPFKKNEGSLTDVINLGRLYLSDLVKNVDSKTVEINSLKEEIKTLLINLEDAEICSKVLEDEIRNLKTDGINLKKLEVSHKSITQKCDDLLKQIGVSKEIINEQVLKLEEKDICNKKLLEDLNKYKENENETKKVLASLNAHLEKTTQEKNTLHSQLKDMAHVLSACGDGEIVKEIATLQEKYSHLQGQYFGLLSEKNDLKALVELNKEEKKTILSDKNCYCKQSEEQQKLLDLLQKNNSGLKEELEKEKITVLALQNERVRHLEEKSALTSMYEHLKNEISNIGKHEGTISTINITANQFAMVAEYNKQVGEKLLGEVAERDLTINELQENVKILTKKHAKIDKQKIALCDELLQINGTKEMLNTKLSKEHRINISLEKYRQKVELDANQRLRELEIMYEKEHAALKDLIKSSKNVIKKRDNLLLKTKSLEEKINALSQDKQILIKKTNNLKTQLEEANLKVKAIEKDCADKITKAEMENPKLENEIINYKQTIELLNETKSKFNEESLKLKKTVDQLEMNLNKLQTDLDLCKKSEIESKRLCVTIRSQNEKYVDTLRNKEDYISNLLEKKQELENELLVLQNNVETLTKQVLKYESEKTAGIIHDKYATKETDRSSEVRSFCGSEMDVYEKDEVIIEMQETIRCLEMVQEEQEKVQKKLLQDNEALQSELTKISIDLLDKNHEIEELENHIHELEQECEKGKRSTVEQNEYYKQCIEEFRSEHKIKISSLKDELNEKSLKLTLEIERYNNLNEEKSKLEKSHKNLAMKLFQSVQFLLAQKLYVQKYVEKIKLLEKEIDKLQEKIKYFNEELKRKDEDILKLKSKLQAVTYEKQQLEHNQLKIEQINYERNNALEAEKQEILDKINNEMVYGEKYTNIEEYFNSSRKMFEENKAELFELQEAHSSLETKYAVLEFQKAEAVMKLHENQVKLQSAREQIQQQDEGLKELNRVILNFVQEGILSYSDYSALLTVAPSHLPEESCGDNS